MKIQQERDAQKIQDLKHIFLSNKYTIRDFMMKSDGEVVTFYKICWTTQSPYIDISFTIDKFFDLIVYFKNIPQKTAKFKFLLDSNLKCDTYLKLNNLIKYLNNLNLPPKSVEDLKIKIQSSLESLTICDETDEDQKKKLTFLLDQFKLIFLSIPRYTSDILIFSSMMVYTYPSAYSFLRNSQNLTLPHPVYLKSFCKGNLRCGVNHQYLTHKFSKLESHEKYVNVLLDEIHVKPSLTYKGYKIDGIADNNPTTHNKTPVLAKCMQAFMISSLLSKNKDIVALYPVFKMDSEFLHSKLNEVLDVLHEIGYEVVSVISDNHQINNAAFKHFSPSQSQQVPLFIKSPYLPNKKIFFLFDTVHLFKSIRNNWLNNKGRSFDFPEFNNPCTIMSARLQHLEKIFKQEDKMLVKYAPALAPKVLFPNAFERQNVPLALRLFDDKNIIAIKHYEALLGSNSVGTAEFIKIVRQWWTTVNVKTPFKGFHIREPLAIPISTSNSQGLDFLNNFCNWLTYWKNLPTGNKLSSRTHTALLHTSQALQHICHYLLNDLKFKYVLTGKFQTDNLEARFGQYRQMSGCCYNVTVQQILQSEKKLKLLSLLKLTKSRNEFFNVKIDLNFSENVSACVDSLEISRIINYAEGISVDPDMLPVLIYISGYIGRKVTQKLNCDECSQKLLTGKDICFDISPEAVFYLKDLDRGGLKYPTEFLISFGVCVYQIFETLTSESFVTIFLNSSRHHDYFYSVVLEYIDVLFLDEICHKCTLTDFHILKKCAKIWGNIFLNNYCKIQNNTVQSLNQLQKTRKLKILTA